MIPPFIQTDSSLTVVINGKAHTMAKDHPSWNDAIALLHKDDVDTEALYELFDISKAVDLCCFAVDVWSVSLRPTV